MNNICSKCKMDKEMQMMGQAFTNYICGDCKEVKQHYNTDTPVRCNLCAKQSRKCMFCDSPIGIKRKVIQIEIAGDTIDAVSDITITNDDNVNIWNEFNGGGNYTWEEFVNCIITVVEISD